MKDNKLCNNESEYAKNVRIANEALENARKIIEERKEKNRRAILGK